MKVGEPFNPYKLFVGVFIPNAIVEYKHLSQGAKLCYGRLSQFAGESGEAWPSMQTISDKLGVSRRQAVSYLKELKLKGFITTIRTPTTDKFIFLWNDVLEASLRSYPQKNDKVVKSTSDGKYSSQPMGSKVPNPREVKFPQRESLKESCNENRPSYSKDEVKEYFNTVKKAFR